MIDTASPARTTFSTAVRELATAQKRGAGVPAYTRYVNRPAGRIVAATAAVLRLSPNQVTLISGVFSAASIALLVLAEPTWPVGVLAGFGLAIGYVFDSADGQLARLLGTAGRAGEWVDHVVDAGRMPALHLGVAIGLYRFTDLDIRWLLVPLGFLLVSTVRFFALILAEQMSRGSAVRPDTSGSALRSLLVLPSDFGVLCLLFFLWPLPVVFLACYGVLFALNAVLLVASLIRRYRELLEV